MNNIFPGEIEVSSYFSQHLGGRIISAGLSVHFHWNQIPGLYFKVECPDEYKTAIHNGISIGMSMRYPNFPNTASLWITKIVVHDVESSHMAFYLVGRMVIEQAYFLGNKPVEIQGEIGLFPNV